MHAPSVPLYLGRTDSGGRGRSTILPSLAPIALPGDRPTQPNPTTPRRWAKRVAPGIRTRLPAHPPPLPFFALSALPLTQHPALPCIALHCLLLRDFARAVARGVFLDQTLENLEGQSRFTSVQVKTSKHRSARYTCRRVRGNTCSSPGSATRKQRAV